MGKTFSSRRHVASLHQRLGEEVTTSKRNIWLKNLLRLVQQKETISLCLLHLESLFMSEILSIFMYPNIFTVWIIFTQHIHIFLLSSVIIIRIWISSPELTGKTWDLNMFEIWSKTCFWSFCLSIICLALATHSDSDFDVRFGYISMFILV